MKARMVTIGQLAFLRMAGVGMQMLILLVIGRVAGPQGVGVLQAFNAWTCTLGEVSAVGLPTYAMQRLSRLFHQKEIGALWRLILAFMLKIACAWGLLMVLLFAFMLLSQSLLPGAAMPTQNINVIYLAMASLGFALTRLASESLKAGMRTRIAVLLESSAPPSVAALYLAVVWVDGRPITGDEILAAFTAGFLATAVCLLLILLVPLLRKLPRDSVHVSRQGIAQTTKLLSLPRVEFTDHAPLWVTAIVSIVFLNYPFLVLPYFASMADTGAFALAFKLLNLITTILLMLSAVYGPRFAQAGDRQDFVGAARLLRQSQWVSLTLYLPVVILLLLGFDGIHPWFGEGFAAGFGFLLILAVGQLVNATTGLAGALLNMMGQGKQEMAISLITLALMALATPVIGMQFGAQGIVGIYAFAVAFKSIGSYCLAKNFVNKDPGVSFMIPGVSHHA